VEVRSNLSGLHAIRVRRAPDGTKRLLGGADPRREGVAVGD
jgi:gamma-glutamyltranspeptidase